MKPLTFSFKDSIIPVKKISDIGKKLKLEIVQMNKITQQGYENDRSSINLSTDKKALQKIKKDLKKQ